MSSAIASELGPPPGLSPQKHRQILEAAAHLFMSHGYEATTVDAIARDAGVSKATVYAHMGSKHELFGRVLSSRCSSLWQTLETGAFGQLDAEAGLRKIGHLFLGLILSREGLDIYRVVVSEAARNPELGRIFFEIGPRVLMARVQEFLEAARQRGEIAFDDAQSTAEAFLGMLQSHQHMTRLLGIDNDTTPAQIDAAVEHAVEIFLRAHRPT